LVTIRTSVVVPVRDGVAHIREAVASALAQLGPEDEAIIVDDGSIDGSVGALACFEGRFTLLQGGGSGPAAARNLGLAQARGTHVAFLDHDDLWPPGRQAALGAALMRADDPHVGALGRTLILADGGIGAQAYAGLHGKHLDWQVMAMLLPVGLVRRVGGFATDMRLGEDIDLGLRLVEAGLRIVHVDADAWVYRRHAGNTTNLADAIRIGQAEAIRRKLQRQRSGAGRQP
jgi:glycosyltransferase involved in cell wall biosynthesis